MNQNVTRWADDWIIENARVDTSLLSDSCIAAEVERFVSDAALAGITKETLSSTVGNLEVYILEEYERKLNEQYAERQGRGD